MGNITESQAQEAAEQLATYLAQQEEKHDIIKDAEDEDGALCLVGKQIYWPGVGDIIELSGQFTLDELQAICLHVQDAQDAQNEPLECAESCACCEEGEV